MSEVAWVALIFASDSFVFWRVTSRGAIVLDWPESVQKRRPSNRLGT